tara:strand:+ start:2793 stop:4049 length:1257 start_codon:yes stop_codon:yes gene_type:complete
MKTVKTFAFILLLFSGMPVLAKNVAIVKMVRGSAHALLNESRVELKVGTWIEEGATVKTSPKSFVRLSFVDKSTMNVGPSSQMKIEKFSKNEAGVINVLSGKIRSQVSKDYLNMDKDKSKLFVKSKSAVMGIRGTDFIFSTSHETGATTAVLFEGSVVFNKFDPSKSIDDLEAIVDRGHRINPGQFSVANAMLAKPTVPAKLASTQFRALKKNTEFVDVAVKEGSKTKRNLVPPGLSGRAVASTEEGLRELSDIKGNKKEVNIDDTKGYVRGNEVKPVDGSLVHIDSGTIIPLGKDSKFDPNTREWVSPSFDVDADGEIVPPQGYMLNDDGTLLKMEKDQFKEVILEVRPLDEVPGLEEIPVNESSVKKGPSPAGLNDLVNGLKRPPIIDGYTIPRENLPDYRNTLPKTPTRFEVIKR